MGSTVAGLPRILLLMTVWVIAGCESTITDPCPGMRTCPNDVCCPLGYTYQCGGQCFTTPCGAAQTTCINVDRTDGCYGGAWNGTFTGVYRPAGGSMLMINGSVVFDIRDAVISASMPVVGTGAMSCESGMGSWTASPGASAPFQFRGTFLHTSDQGDRILSSTFSYTDAGGSADGTWTALRID